MADDTVEAIDLAVNDEYFALVLKILAQQASSLELEADVAHAVELYLVAAKGYSVAELRGYQTEIQSIITGDLGPENAAAIATNLELLLNGNAQHSPDVPSQTSGVAGEPVHLGSGQFIYTVTDFVVAGAGIDLVFARTYKSGAFYFGPLGASWDHAYNLWLRDNGTSVTVTTGRLLPIRYMRHKSFPYYLALGDDSIVVATVDGAFEQRTPDGRAVRFEQIGDADGTIYRVVRVADRFSNALEFAYDIENRLATVSVNHPERVVTLKYDEQSRIQDITLFPVSYATGTQTELVWRRWAYVYDDFADLVTVTGPPTDEFPAGRTMRYAYSSAESSAERQHDLLSVRDPNGNTFLENEFGTASGTVAYGKVVRQRVGGGVFLFEYAQVNARPDWTFADTDRPASCVTVVQRDGHPVRYVLNATGNILASQETVSGADERAVVRRFAYDADGRLTATVSPEGRVTQTYYGREHFYRRQISGGDRSLPIWQDPNLSPAEHARFANVLASVQRSAVLTLPGLLTSFAIYGTVFPDVLAVSSSDIIVKLSYESTFQQRATISDARYTASPDPAAAESQDPQSAYSRHLTVTAFNTDAGVTPASITYPSTTYPAPLPNGVTGVLSARTTFEAYAPNGALLRWADSVGNIGANRYFPPSAAEPTTEGFLATSTLGVGALDLSTSYAVNEAGQVTAISDPLGHTRQYAIDAAGLVRRSSPPIAGYAVAYGYDGNTQVASRRVAIIDCDGSTAANSPEVATFSYSSELSVLRATIGDGSGASPRETARVYDSSNRLIRLVLPRGNSTCYEYDHRSLLTRITSGCCEPEAATTALKYDLDERPISVTDPRGYTTSATLDAFARQVGRTDALGNIQRTEYDKVSNPIVEWGFGSATGGNYPLLRRTEYLYDERGQVVRIRRALFQAPIETADPWGAPDAEFGAAVQAGIIQWCDTLIYRDGNLRVFRVVDANGKPTTVEYDAANREIATTDATGNVTRTEYDAAGNVRRQDRYLVDAGGTTRAVISTAYEYDALNRLKATVDGAGNRVTYGVDSRSLTESVIDPLGHVSTTSFNGFRELVAATRQLVTPGGGGSASDITTTKAFDANGNVVRVTDPAGNATVIEYDGLDRPTRVINADGTARTFEYDRSGNVVGLVDEEGGHVSVAYDGLDRAVARVVSTVEPGFVSPENSAQFAYDGAGQVVGHANGVMTATRSCDSLGRCFEETVMFGPQFTAPTVPLPLTRQFDCVSNRVGLRYPSGQTLAYGFDDDNRLLQLRATANAADYPGDPNAPAVRSIFENQRWGDLTAGSRLGNGVAVTTAYDAAGRRIGDKTRLADGNEFLLQELWDGAGNRALTVESNSGAVVGWWHQYDSTNRLIRSADLPNPAPVVDGALGPPTVPLPLTGLSCQQAIDSIVSGYGAAVAGPAEYVYDATGDRLTQRVGQSSLAYVANSRNEYTSVGATPYEYDRAGRLVSDGSFSFGYNFRGQLVHAAQNGQRVLEVFHDAIGRPVGVVEAGTARALVLDQGNLIESYDNGSLAAVYVWETSDGVRFVAARGEDRYGVRDVLESTRLTSDLHGLQTNTFRYDAFGRRLAGGSSSQIQYAGKYLYESIDWYEYGTRQYVPGLGRFAQTDPAGFVDGANLYTFVGNNPLSATDPNGTDLHGVARAAQTLTPTALGGGVTPVPSTPSASPSPSGGGGGGGGRPLTYEPQGYDPRPWSPRGGPRLGPGLEPSGGPGPEVGARPLGVLGALGIGIVVGYEIGRHVETPWLDPYLPPAFRFPITDLPPVPPSPVGVPGVTGPPVVTPPPSRGTGTAPISDPGLGRQAQMWMGRPNTQRRGEVAYWGWYWDPFTGKVRTGIFDVMQADHIVPDWLIRRMPGFDKLTEGERNTVLNYENNFQPLPGWLNQSKGTQTYREWTKAPAKPCDPASVQNFDPAYIGEMQALTLEIERELQGMIDYYNGKR